ncbi:MAG: hypothetical protein QUS07_01740 [Methanothrix sp.]|nr:hypothetical protein [Methanothrix sp.]
MGGSISELRRALGLSTQEHDGAIGDYLERRGTAGGGSGWCWRMILFM